MLGSLRSTIAAAAIGLATAAVPVVMHAQSAAPAGDSAAAQAAPAHRHRHPLFRGITLTSDQRSQLKAIRAKYHPQIKEARQSNDRATMHQLRGQMVSEARGVLTPDQQKQFDSNLQALKARRKAKTQGGGATPAPAAAQPTS
jgi:Spy/CpxP family protein refolding chaperone